MAAGAGPQRAPGRARRGFTLALLLALAAVALWWCSLAGLGLRTAHAQPVAAPAAPASAAQLVVLSAEEAAFLRSHGPVRVIVGAQVEPFYRTGPSGEPIGYAIDLLREVAARTGLRFEWQRVTGAREGLAALREGRADMTVILRSSPERATYLTLPRVLLSVEGVLVTRRDAPVQDLAEVLRSQRIAVASASVDDEQLTREHPQARVQRYPSLREAFEAVATGGADAALAELHSAIWFIEAHLLSNLQVRRIEGSAREAWGPAVRRDLPQLASILAKALDTVTPAERSELARRWLPQGTSVDFAARTARLGAAEREWVERHGSVRVGFDARFYPYTQAGEMGGFEGLGADLMRAAAAKVGLSIVGQIGATFAEVYERALRGEIDVVVGMARNAEREKLFHFIGPFGVAPTVIVTRRQDGQPLVGELRDLGPGRRVGLLAQHFLMPELRSRLPALQLVEYGTQEAALKALAEGRLDAVIGNGFVTSRLIQDRHIGQLRVSGVVRGGDSDLFFAVPRAKPELARVLAQGFEALQPGELAQMRQRWLLITVQTGVTWGAVLPWLVPLGVAFTVVVVVLLLANRRLRAAYARVAFARASAEDATAARGRFIAYLAHELRGGVGGVAAAARLLRQGQATPQMQRELLEVMQTSAEQVGELLETTLEGEKVLAQGIQLAPQAHELAAWWQATAGPLRLRARERGQGFEEIGPPAGLVRHFDGPRLAQAVANVVGNAIRYGEQGRVSVNASWREPVLRVEVRDEGPGLSEADRAQLFEPYARGSAGRRQRGGAGLGLAIARQIVLAMGGRIEAPPFEGPGALIVIEVPLAAPAPTT